MDFTNNREIMLALQKISFTGSITIEYSGGGDSGRIDDIIIDDVLHTRESLEELLLPREYGSEEKNWMAFITGWADHLTDSLEYDWYNNDGGGGTITIEPQSGLIKVDAYYNEMQKVDVDIDDLSMPEDDTAFTHKYGGEETLPDEVTEKTDG